MPKLLEKPPKVSLPECKGCEKCGAGYPTLCVLWHDDKWYCVKCFSPAGWPKKVTLPQVVFDDVQREEAVRRGTERRASHANKQGNDYQVSGKNKLQMDIEGAYGEVAGRVFFERYDLDIVDAGAVNLDGKGDKVDLIVEGVGIAIKTVGDGLNLLEPGKQPFKDDQAILLVWSDFNKCCTMRGWTTGKLFHRTARPPKPTMDPGTKWMAAEDLRPMDELIRRLSRRRDERRLGKGAGSGSEDVHSNAHASDGGREQEKAERGEAAVVA